ncbi:putative reverse transcriptase domain, reverse transcriptase zinc-binding domain protein [Tanacetum coccineum]
MGNIDFMDCFPGSFAIFQPYRISDHSPAVLKFPNLTSSKPKPFNFFNFLAYKIKFLDVVVGEWNVNINGYSMFKVVTKLKRLKKPIRKLLHDQGNIHERVDRLRVELDQVQRALDSNSADSNLRDEESQFLGTSTTCSDLNIDELFSRRVSDMAVANMVREELMHNYHRNRGPPRCTFKIDIQKAYETVNWDFLEIILVCFGFPSVMVRWIMTCVSSTTFSLCINENIHGFFKGKRGLRKGDPLSPYLFTMVMEVLTLILKRMVRLFDSFRYHKQCKEFEIINVFFADDLFIFARGDVNSACVILESLDEFKSVSGLIPSIPKSTAYFCNVIQHVKQAILNIMPFSEGELPVTYLGVPLILSRLLN